MANILVQTLGVSRIVGKITRYASEQFLITLLRHQIPVIQYCLAKSCEQRIPFRISLDLTTPFKLGYVKLVTTLVLNIYPQRVDNRLWIKPSIL